MSFNSTFARLYGNSGQPFAQISHPKLNSFPSPDVMRLQEMTCSEPMRGNKANETTSFSRTEMLGSKFDSHKDSEQCIARSGKCVSELPSVSQNVFYDHLQSLLPHQQRFSKQISESIDLDAELRARTARPAALSTDSTMNLPVQKTKEQATKKSRCISKLEKTRLPQGLAHFGVKRYCIFVFAIASHFFNSGAQGSKTQTQRTNVRSEIRRLYAFWRAKHICTANIIHELHQLLHNLHSGTKHIDYAHLYRLWYEQGCKDVPRQVEGRKQSGDKGTYETEIVSNGHDSNDKALQFTDKGFNQDPEETVIGALSAKSLSQMEGEPMQSSSEFPPYSEIDRTTVTRKNIQIQMVDRRKRSSKNFAASPAVEYSLPQNTDQGKSLRPFSLDNGHTSTNAVEFYNSEGMKANMHQEKNQRMEIQKKPKSDVKRVFLECAVDKKQGKKKNRGGRLGGKSSQTRKVKTGAISIRTSFDCEPLPPTVEEKSFNYLEGASRKVDTCVGQKSNNKPRPRKNSYFSSQIVPKPLLTYKMEKHCKEWGLSQVASNIIEALSVAITQHMKHVLSCLSEIASVRMERSKTSLSTTPSSINLAEALQREREDEEQSLATSAKNRTHLRQQRRAKLERCGQRNQPDEEEERKSTWSSEKIQDLQLYARRHKTTSSSQSEALRSLVSDIRKYKTRCTKRRRGGALPVLPGSHKSLHLDPTRIETKESKPEQKNRISLSDCVFWMECEPNRRKSCLLYRWLARTGLERDFDR